jgi:DNA-binding NarL/FixJ family response regulator
VLHLLLRAHEERQDNDRLLAALTPREREVLSCLADGAERREVAERLHLSANTVRTHLQNLMAKLGVHSTLEAVAISRPHLQQVRGGVSV